MKSLCRKIKKKAGLGKKQEWYRAYTWGGGGGGGGEEEKEWYRACTH